MSGCDFVGEGAKAGLLGEDDDTGIAKTTSQLSKTPELQEDSPLGDRRAFCLSMKKARILARSGVNGAKLRRSVGEGGGATCRHGFVRGVRAETPIFTNRIKSQKNSLLSRT